MGIESKEKVELKKEKKEEEEDMKAEIGEQEEVEIEVEIEEDEELPEWMWDEERSSLPVRQLVFTEEKVVVRVYALARALSSAFSQHGVQFWTSGGTTLGIVRHGGLIPWDDDLDVCLREQDEHLLEKGQLGKTLEAVGCKVARAKDYSWKVWLEDQSDDIVSGGKTESYRFPFCDIFIMCKRKGRYEGSRAGVPGLRSGTLCTRWKRPFLQHFEMWSWPVLLTHIFTWTEHMGLTGMRLARRISFATGQ